MNEWGRYNQRREDARVSLHQENVIEAIQDDNPSITSVQVPLKSELQIDWGAAGKCLGNSTHVKHLDLNIVDLVNSNLSLFCEGLVLNRSIESLGIQLCEGAMHICFVQLLTFFSNNTKVTCLSLTISEELDESVIDAIESCTSLKSISVCFHNLIGRCMDRAIEVIFKKQRLQHISLSNCFISSRNSFEIRTVS
jgi:hypothetical protein